MLILVYEKIFQSKHVIDEQDLSIKELPPAIESSIEPFSMVNDGGTVVVRGFQQPVHESMLDLYFTNELKSGGGPIDRIVMKEKEIFVVFTDQESRSFFISCNY